MYDPHIAAAYELFLLLQERLTGKSMKPAFEFNRTHLNSRLWKGFEMYMLCCVHSEEDILLMHYRY